MSSQSKKITPKKVLQYLLLLVIAILLIYYSFKGVDWSEFWSGVIACNWWWIGLSMIIGVIEFIIRSLRWQLLLKQIHPSTKFISAYRGVNIGNLANFAVPRIGEIVRCSVVSTSERVPFESAVGTVVAERVWDLVCLFMLTLGILFSQGEFSNFIRTNIFGRNAESGSGMLWIILGVLAALLVAVVIFCFITRNSKSISTAAQNNQKSAPKEVNNHNSEEDQNQTNRGGMRQKIQSFIYRFKDGLLSALKMKRKWLFFLLTVLLWGCYLLTSRFIIIAFPHMNHTTWGDALFLMVVGSLGWAVPVQAGIGAYHFIISLALMQVYSISQSESLAFATISHSSQAVVMIILGVISVIGFAIQKRKILKTESQKIRL